MLQPLRHSISRKLLAAVGLPSLAVALAGLAWLGWEAATRPEWRVAFPIAAAGLALFGTAMVFIHALAVRFYLEQPLQRLGAAMKRAREGDFLHRVEVHGEDELAELARTYNATLAAITDLHALRIDDAAERSALQREVALKAQLEARVRELELLHRLAEALAAAPDLDALAHRVADLAAARVPGTRFALLLAEPATGELAVRGVAALDAAAVGTRLAPGSGLAGRAVAERRMVHAAGPELDDALPGAAPGEIGSAVAVPMLHQDACLGALLYGRASEKGFPDDELRILESVARQVATAVENVRLHQTMVRLSQQDALTGVQNRRQLFARLELERERAARFGEPFALLLLDVDRFRELNEAVGHAAGDGVLREVAALLARELRTVDLVARYGGEEFAVVLPRAGAEEALATAERLRAAVEGSGFEGAPGGRVTVSVGVACFPADARDQAGLVDCADAALFAAKRAGRNLVRRHEAEMREAPGRRRDVRTTGAA